MAVGESPSEVYLLNIFFSLLLTSVTRQVRVSVKGWGTFFFFWKSKAFKFTTFSDKVSKTMPSPEGPLSNNGDGWLLPFLAKKACSCDYIKGLNGDIFLKDLCRPPCNHKGLPLSPGGRQPSDRQKDLKMPSCWL